MLVVDNFPFYVPANLSEWHSEAEDPESNSSSWRFTMYGYENA
jgi:hypothetical protein